MVLTVSTSRVDRILDAAAELTLRWGYKRTTIEEVARHAGIGKGTVYLHFSTRGSLFTGVLVRESVGVVADLVDAIRADPVAMLPAGQAELNFLAVTRRPLLRALFSRDIEVLGDLCNQAAGSLPQRRKAELTAAQFRLWREHGLVRTDLDLETQDHILNATQTGFYLSGSLGGPSRPPEVTARALAHTVRAALQPPDDPDPGLLATLAPKVIDMHERYAEALAAVARGDGPRARAT